MLLSGQSLSRYYLEACSLNLQLEKGTTVQGGYRKEEPIFLFQIKMHCSKCPYFSCQAALLSPIVSEIRKLLQYITTMTVLNTWGVSPSQVIIGPGSNPSTQVHSKPPTTFLQVPFPHGFPTAHSSVSARS